MVENFKRTELKLIWLSTSYYAVQADYIVDINCVVINSIYIQNNK